MKVAINGLRMVGPLTGMARYLTSLLQEWQREPGSIEQINLYTHRTLGNGRASMIGAAQHETLSRWMPYILSEQLLLPRAAKAASADVLFCPAFTMPVGYREPCVVTIHDVIQEVMAETLGLWARVRHAPLYRYSARRATRVLTDSESSKRDILKHYDVPAQRVVVTPLAAARCFHLLQGPEREQRLAAVRRKFGIGDRPFVLFVGKLSRRRNIPWLLLACAAAFKQRPEPYRLVMVGVNGLKLPLAQYVRQARMDGRVVHLPKTSDEDLVALYNAAELFVLPSLYEGFGLPPLEAMACGCPTVVFRNSSLVEVGGDAAYYPKTSDEPGLAQALTTVLTSASLREELHGRGLERAKLFSWQRTARDVRQVLEEACRR